MIRTSFAAALAVFCFVGTAQAASVTYSDFVVDNGNAGTFPTPVVTIDDDSNPGFLTFSIGSTGVSGQLSGFFFDTSGVVFSQSDIVGENIVITSFQSAANTVGNLGGGVNSNGGFPIGPGGNTVVNPRFDAGIRIAQTDISTTPFIFRISTGILTLADVVGDPLSDPQFGFFRFQTVSGPGVTQDSSKVIGSAEPVVTPVPLPATAWLILAGLGGLVGLRRASA